jgi:hypothetical protein
MWVNDQLRSYTSIRPDGRKRNKRVRPSLLTVWMGSVA